MIAGVVHSYGKDNGGISVSYAEDGFTHGAAGLG